MTEIDFAFESDRLSVVSLDADIDIDVVAAIISPNVTEHLPPDLQTSPDTDPAMWLARLRAGGDVFSVIANKTLIGFLTLHRQSAGEIMIGYLFGQQHWGKGYASELAKGFVANLKQQGWQGKIQGGVDAGNPASAAVLKKAGFASIGPGPSGVEFFQLEL